MTTGYNVARMNSVSVRLDDELRENLNALAKRQGLKVTHLIRMILTRATNGMSAIPADLPVSLLSADNAGEPEQFLTAADDVTALEVRE